MTISNLPICKTNSFLLYLFRLFFKATLGAENCECLQIMQYSGAGMFAVSGSIRHSDGLAAAGDAGGHPGAAAGLPGGGRQGRALVRGGGAGCEPQLQ